MIKWGGGKKAASERMSLAPVFVETGVPEVKVALKAPTSTRIGAYCATSFKLPCTAPGGSYGV